MIQDIIENHSYKDECQVLYDKFVKSYGDKMLEREHFNDICTNMVRVAIPYINAIEPMKLEQVVDLPKLNFIDRLKYVLGL